MGTDVHRAVAKLYFGTQELIGKTVSDDYPCVHFGVSAGHVVMSDAGVVLRHQFR
jgi:hypothetical protein